MAQKQRPSVGRMVHYTTRECGRTKAGVRWAAMITAVYEPNDAEKKQGVGTVCALTIFPPGATPYPTIDAIREGAPGEEGTWHWPERV
ncbi:hypothetical protein [Methylobacterium sp. AMS5]|uniref:hypothetical protein n=1 Tax=Methylobacterium sp. AMS5 TaxID=925818 RepID=UPI00074F8990|nr:hypothetical protein [Methylobacterium sp. AMS5]AMB48371.1 hypothetical protein Y590_25720 [Methylobacterium sp. AMS5]